MHDRLGRAINYLRLSITDRCNLRCCYCMPKEGAPACGHNEILRYEELLRIVRVAAELGVNKVRVTGGEPLVRKGVMGFLRQLNEIQNIQEVTLTTNGLLLQDQAAEIRSVGVERVNVSLDSLQPETYKNITRGGALKQVLAGLETAEKEGLKLKLNMVVMRGINDSEIEDFAALSIEYPWSVRFVEYMPTTRDKSWQSQVISGADILRRLQQQYDIEAISVARSCAPARPYRIRNAQGTLGIISPMTEHFCSYCNRIRVTSTGLAKNCLLSNDAIDLKPFLSDGDDNELRTILMNVAASKGLQHNFLESVSEETSFAMSNVGG